MASYARTGAIAGLLAGMALALFLLAVGERSLGQAVRLQAAHTLAETGAPPEQMFTRDGQLVGGALGSIIFGTGMGAVFGVVFSAMRHRLPGGDDWQRAVWLAASAWVVLWAVPAAKYPPNPPGVGNPATITRRTLLWLTLIAWSVCSAWAVSRLGRWLRARDVAAPMRLSAQAAAYAALIAVVAATMPPTGDPVAPPANLVWHFRLASLGGQMLMWTVLGASFGLLSWRRGHSESAMSAALAVPA